INESRLQQSLSTPCNGSEEEMHPGQQRKDSEYRRFKSEGSTAGASLPAAEKTHMDELSPVDQRSTNTTRFALMQQDSVVNPSVITKLSNTEQVAMMHTLKTKLSKYQLFLDRAFEASEKDAKDSDQKIIECCTICIKVMKKAWTMPKVSYDLANALCDYLRDRDYLDRLIKMLISTTGTPCDQVKLSCGKVLEECMSSANRDYIVNKDYVKKIMLVAMKLTKSPDQQRLSLSLLENLFKHSNAVSLRFV
uniref:CBP80/20-dependent translation initiation factor n=1 Tax=Caenorhabditis tropicalis TaxID=1561998 RepID=A0A1I7T5J4_9PELO